MADDAESAFQRSRDKLSDIRNVISIGISRRNFQEVPPGSVERLADVGFFQNALWLPDREHIYFAQPGHTLSILDVMEKLGEWDPERFPPQESEGVVFLYTGLHSAETNSESVGEDVVVANPNLDVWEFLDCVFELITSPAPELIGDEVEGSAEDYVNHIN